MQFIDELNRLSHFWQNPCGGVVVLYPRRMIGGHRNGDLPATLSPATGQRSVCWRASAIARARLLFSQQSRVHICAGHCAHANISAGDRAHFGDRAQTFQPASSAIYNMCIASFLQTIKRIPARQPCLATLSACNIVATLSSCPAKSEAASLEIYSV